MMKGIMPTVRNYKRSYLGADILAGIIVAAVSIPISMGYAQIAGLPAYYGLYGSVIPILLFALLSTSRQFVVGVDAAPAALVGSALTVMGVEAGSQEAGQLVPVLTLVVAMWLILFSALRVGKLVSYISKPVMGGFISGIACTIILMQVPKLMGHGTVTGELFEMLYGIGLVLDDINFVSLGLGVGAVVIILLAKKVMPKFPMSVLIMVVGVLLTIFGKIDERFGVALLASVDSGLPQLHHFSWGNWDVLMVLETTFSVGVVITASSLLAENNFANKNGYEIEKNREIFGYGLSNLGAALVGCCPINGSVSRTSMTEQFGSKSQLASVVAGVSMLLVLLFGTGFIEYLPVPILTGIVMAALIGVIEWKLAKRLYKESKVELFIFLGAFFGVLIFGTVVGVIIGIVLSFIDVLIRTTNTPHSLLGVVPGKSGFHSLERSSGAREIKNTVIYRFRGSLFFANFDRFEQELLKNVKEDTRYVLIDASGVNDIDMSAADGLVLLNEKMKRRGIRFFFTEHRGEVNDKLRQYGAQQLIEDGVVRRTISAALRDVHMYPPYPLVDNTEEHVEFVMLNKNRSLMEFEWAYGKEAEKYMEAYAKEVIAHLSEYDGINLEEGWYLGHNKVKQWQKLGHLDEQVLLYHLELHLAEMAKKLDMKEITIQEALERRRAIITERLQKEAGAEYYQVMKRVRQFEQHMKEDHPELFEEIMEIRAKIQKESEEWKNENRNGL